MKQKGSAEAMVLGLVGIAIAAILVSQVAMTAIYAPQGQVATPLTNSTAITNLNQTPFKGHNFTLTNIDSAAAGSLVITFQGDTNKINVTVNDVAVGNLTTSPTTLTVPATITLTATTRVNYTYVGSSSGAINATNITKAVLTYPQKGSYYSWDSGTQTMWFILPIALVATLLIFVFAGRKT
jgi:hypothetical protein